MIIDRLYENVQKKGPVCVGLDTAIDYIPQSFIDKYSFVEDAIFRFNQRIIDATFDISACYKVQIAYYEAMGLKGLMVYKKTLKYIREKGGIVIADIKRGDIAKTAEMYAKAHFEGEFESDIITLNPYMGFDSIFPYLPYVNNREKGVFILLRTSNKGAQDLQYIETYDNRKIYDIMGEKIQMLGQNYKGQSGYSSIGAVMGCTHKEEGVKLRERFSDTFFLIPGYGAQGGKAEDVAVYLKDCNGGVVNASRSILLAYKKVKDGYKIFDFYARAAVFNMKNEIQKACRIKNKSNIA